MQAIASEIETVTVYASGAVVTRVAELAASDGHWPAQVRIAGLPLALEDASVRIRVENTEGGPGPRAVGVRVGLEVNGESAAEEPSEESWRTARRQVSILEDRLKDVQRLSARCAGIALPARPKPAEGEAPPPSPHAGRMALSAFQQQRLGAMQAEAADLRQRLRSAREILNSATEKKRLAACTREARPNELRKTVVVALVASDAGGGRSKLVIEYRVPGARWAPSYALHFDKDMARSTISLRAMVAQRTGEDWRNVRLTLSTAQMQAWTELPELTSLRVGRWQSPPRSGWRSAPTGADTLYADYDRQASLAPKPVNLAAVEAAVWEEAPAGHSPSDTVEFTAGPDTMLPPPPLLRVPPGARPSPPTSAPSEVGEFTRMFAPTPMPAPPPMAPVPAAMRAGRVRRPPTAEFPIPMPPPPPPAQEPPHQPAPATLEYGAMYMPGPGDAGRGKLTRMEWTARFEVFAEVKVQVDAAVVRNARAEVDRLGLLPPAYLHAAPVEGFDYAYRAALPVEIPSDGEYHSISLAEQSAATRLYYVTVPREAPDAFRFAEIGNPLDAPLLPGPADIYVGNAFLMTAPLRLTPVKGVIKLGLGVEQRIKVARNTTFAEVAAGLMGGTLNLKHEIRVELRNQLRVPAQIEVRERVPVTRDGDDQLKVTVTAKPAWEPYQPDHGSLRGGYVWKVQVPPAETVQLNASYNIAMPTKMEIAAGNRREA